jgi:hypothetical protein
MSLQPKDLFVSDDAPKADAAIVCGCSDAAELQQRTTAAVKLLLSGKTGLLLLCAGGRSQSEDNESQRMTSIAVQAGALPQQLITVSAAGELSEIARACAKLLKQDVRLTSIRSLWLVSSAWHMLRLRIVMKQHLPRQLRLLCHPTDSGITAANWMKQPRGRALAENEIRLIEKLLKNGYSLK